ILSSIMNTLLLVAFLSIGIVFSEACVDLVNPLNGLSDCAARKSLCNDSVYFSLMTTQCPKTCGRCPGPPLRCVDLVNPNTGVSECAATAYLCNNPIYYSTMTTQCPKTCGRC
ncbi:hypothetical protein PFISCL1PPCAC_15058, partial [Pristionchus fissidentatus]